jgi:hypothetical protein
MDLPFDNNSVAIVVVVVAQEETPNLLNLQIPHA